MGESAGGCMHIGFQLCEVGAREGGIGDHLVGTTLYQSWYGRRKTLPSLLVSPTRNMVFFSTVW